MPAIPYPRFRTEVLDLYRPPHRRQATYLKMRKVLDEFAAIPGVTSTSDITPGLLTRWVAAHGDRKPITNRSYLGAFRAAVNIAKRLRWLRVSPWEVRRDWIDWGDDDDDGPARTRHLAVDQVARLLDRADAEARAGDWTAQRLRALVYTYVYTGMRKSEALGLRAEDVHPGRRAVLVRSRRRRRLKTRSSRRWLALHPELAAVLADWLPRCGSDWLFPGSRRRTPWLNGPHGGKALDQARALGARAGVPHLTLQALRRSLATHARRFGLGPLEVRDLLGHTSERTQEWYLEDDLADQHAAVAKIAYRGVRD